MTPVRPQRPGGVTALAVLAIIGGVLSLLGGIALLALIGYVNTNSVSATTSSGTTTTITGGLAAVLGIFSLLSGVLALAFGIGAFRGAGWAWILGIIAQGLGAVSNVVSIGYALTHNNTSTLISPIVSLVIEIAIIAYLNSARVKQYFGRA